MRLARLLLALLVLVWTAPATALAPEADPALTARIDGLVAILAGTGDYRGYFTDAFKKDVPQSQFETLAAQLKAALGAPLRISATTPATRFSATVTVAYERGNATIDIAIESAPPNAVSGLIVRGTAVTGDSFARLEADFRALPEMRGLGVYVLGNGSPRPSIEIDGGDALPLGSGFKLWILAETARQVKAGKRHWADVLPLGPPSLASGITQTWPAATPMTLQSLATLMISISDNTAADTLFRAFGRQRIEAVARANGAPLASFPVLTTREAFVLKGDPKRSASWAKASLAARRAMLADPAFAAVKPNPKTFGDTPVATNEVEWFASPRAMAGLLGDFTTADATTRAILATNPGTDPATAALFDYVGYKGGSEPGVISASFLARRKDGRWIAVTGGWHRTRGETPALTFLALMNRALALAAKE